MDGVKWQKEECLCCKCVQDSLSMKTKGGGHQQISNTRCEIKKTFYCR